MVYRIYVEKKDKFNNEATALRNELENFLEITGIKNLRILNRYDVEGIDKDLFKKSIPLVFSEPQVDNINFEFNAPKEAHIFAVEFLPGQFDQRADSASECILLISQNKRPIVRYAKIYIIEGVLSENDIKIIKKHVINPVEAREANLDKPDTLKIKYNVPDTVEVLEGFLNLSKKELNQFIENRGLAMDLEDIQFCQEYFINEGRCPTITEIKMIDTYWSDHCRHTTFGTILDNIQIEDVKVKAAFNEYLKMRKELGRENKNISLMDMATLGSKWLRTKGYCSDIDESEEINACTIKIKCDNNGHEEDWLYLFKNETHNHPTEIEPFGGAATCIGGAIRDPLSGRSYVYQAMRLTGASDPTVDVKDTISGKLPQRNLVVTAAEGYSSYGNQIGLATGSVHELYHPGYAAKRMEIGAVVGAAPAENVKREKPEPGDVILLLGGKTGRDGIGGATGSSKAHKKTSLETCSAEVQKGNAPIERKLQRLFRRKDACRLIKRCNDFGAGGVSVAVGELADGLRIDLNKIPKKYEGLDGTEIAISESQERMAIVLDANDIERFKTIAKEENLEAVKIAEVTASERVIMNWNGVDIVNISRKFLASNGAPKHQNVQVPKMKEYVTNISSANLEQKFIELVSDLNTCSNKGLSERFDSTIGAATVLMPFGGKTQLSPTQTMVAKLPVDAETNTCSGMAWGFNPKLSEVDQYSAAYLAVIESISKLISSGFSQKKIYLTFQEYFERLGSEPKRWGKPVAAVLGALMSQKDFHIGAIGGKDSMSGSFENLDVPPTLVSFATAVGNVSNITSVEFKSSGNNVYLASPNYNGILPEPNSQNALFAEIESLVRSGKIKSIATISYDFLAAQLFRMSVGNQIGLEFDNDFNLEELFKLKYGSFIFETTEDLPYKKIAVTTTNYLYETADETINLAKLQELWESGLEDVFPYRRSGKPIKLITYNSPKIVKYTGASIAKPKVLIPVFPGTNCEFDSEKAFERANAKTDIFVINNLKAENVTESARILAKKISDSQIIFLPGGFSAGDEPEGSAKMIASFFRNPMMTEAVRKFIQIDDGLMLGICNGFQALIKLGLVPFGDIVETDSSCPTLTYNTISRHISKLVCTRVASNLSPWFNKCKLGDIHTIAISHGEGRFVANEEILKKLIANGQIATQYVNNNGNSSMDWSVNPNDSVYSIEGITSPDGRILGKMAHSERSGANLYKNVPGNKYQPLFEAGVAYFA